VTQVPSSILNLYPRGLFLFPPFIFVIYNDDTSQTPTSFPPPRTAMASRLTNPVLFFVSSTTRVSKADFEYSYICGETFHWVPPVLVSDLAIPPLATIRQTIVLVCHGPTALTSFLVAYVRTPPIHRTWLVYFFPAPVNTATATSLARRDSLPLFPPFLDSFGFLVPARTLPKHNFFPFLPPLIGRFAPFLDLPPFR